MGTEALTGRFEVIYDRLLARYGRQCWWPAEFPFEVMVGAILTQSAAWGNVEKVIAGLKATEALSPPALRRMKQAELAGLIYPSGYYNAKAKKLKALADWVGKYCGDDISRLTRGSTQDLRRQLLGVHGVGPETADSILLYAAGRPVFVIDAYTRRIIDRLGLSPDGRGSYDDYQRLFTASLPADAGLFNEYHALLVRLGKETCRRKPVCSRCCLTGLCRFAADGERR
ncbi:MAG: endonuclease [Dehalococcoidales bacterium]